MLYSFSNDSAEEKVHVDYEESVFLFREAETTIYASLIDFGEEQSKLTSGFWPSCLINTLLNK